MFFVQPKKNSIGKDKTNICQSDLVANNKFDAKLIGTYELPDKCRVP